MVPSSFTRKFLIVVAFLVCIFYLTYRALWTFNDTGSYAYTASLLLYIAEAFGIFNLFLFFLQVWEVDEPPPQPVLEGRTVDVFVPTYNEDVALLRATLEACVRMDYPHKTYVLDDGRRPEVEALARQLGIDYITRPDNRHFKAGNLNHAFERTDGEFVVVLDADHVPEPHFITRVIGYFADDKLGYVQTPHAFYNFDSFQARLDHKNRKYWEEGHLFYYVIQPGRNRWGCPIFAGSAAMFRRAAIRDVGLMATETITEDMHTGLRMNAKGWKSLAITERLVAGQAAPDITTFHAQRLRWGTGNLSIFRYDNPLTRRGLTLAQRLCYLGSMLHWASGLFKLIIYLTPVAMLFTGIPPVKEFTWELVRITLIYLIVSLFTMKIVSNGYGSIINAELFSMVNFWTQIKAIVRATFGYGSRVFNVTPKGTTAAIQRRQPKSVWPYIRPQTYLIILSVLALFWGWGRLAFDGALALEHYPNLRNMPVIAWLLRNTPSFGFGISDDYFKPVVPTVWVLIHFWLAYKVTQRAFWPADRRFTTRHVVHVPVEYAAVANAAPAPGTNEHARYGVTVDLNDTGMAFVAYERFGSGDVLRFTIRGAGEVIKCKGEIKTVTDLTRKQVADGFRYGVQFQNLTPPQVDALNRICLHYGVPRMYGEYDRTRGGVLGMIQKRLERGPGQRRGEQRNHYRLPIVVNSGQTEDTAQFCATEDLSRSAVAALLDHPMPNKTAIGYLMASPLGEVRGTARVVRSQPALYGGRTYYRTVFEFDEFEGQGRTTLHSLVNPDESGPLKESLKPDRRPIAVNMAGATLVAILIAIPLVLLQSGIFQYYHRDDFTLREVSRKAKAGETLTDDDAKEVDRIFKATMAPDASPTSDRLVLLMNALRVYDRKQDQLMVAKELAGRNTSDLTLQQSLIYAQVKANEYAQAEETYEKLRTKAGFERFTDEQKKQYLLSGARVADGRDARQAIERYRELYNQDQTYVGAGEQVVDATGHRARDQETPLYREFAGVLLKAGLSDPKYFDEAKGVLERDADAEDLADQRMLIATYLLKGRSIANDPNVQEVRRGDLERAEYDGAQRVAESISILAERKGDAKLKAVADTMRADILMARQAWSNAQEIVRKMGAVAGGPINSANADLYRRLAHATLGEGKDYVGALSLFEELLENGLVSGYGRAEVVKGFLDAAAQPTVALTEREKNTVTAIYNELDAQPVDDPVYLARLGWVLQRAQRLRESQIVLERAIQKAPQNVHIQEQLANILIESGNISQAARVLAGANAFRGKETLAGVYVREGNLTRAEEQLRDLLQNYPVGYRNPDGHVVAAEDYRRAEMLLGTVLGLAALKTDAATKADAFTRAIAHYEQLDRRYPTDKEVPTALGNVFLWAAERATAQADKDEAYSAALKQFQKVLANKNWSPDPKSVASRSKVEQGFIDAAASASAIDGPQTATAREIAAQRLRAPAGDPIGTARLAWVLIKTKDEVARKDAVGLLQRAVAVKPTRPEDIRELAGVLAAAKEFKSAADLLVPLKKTPADSLKLAELYAGARQWDLAKAELSAVRAKETEAPEAARAATREWARVTAWAGDHAEALALIGEIVRANPDDLEMKIFQADVNVWAKNFDAAQAQFQALIRRHPNNLQIVYGFISAAAKAQEPLDDEATGIILRLTEQATAPDNRDALLLARLAEAYATKLDERTGRQFAQKASQLDPTDPITRKEVGYVLAHPKIGLFKEADALLSSIDLRGEERKQYVSIASQAENYEAARKQARIYLSEQIPGSLKEREARRLLADVLTWKGDYEEAIAIYERLLEGQKTDRELRVNIAEVHRFWQNYPTALRKYAELLAEEFENTRLWIGFIDAASSAPQQMIDDQKPLLMRIHDRYASDIQDPRRMSRLAWVMIRLGEAPKANALLNRAVAANPQQPAVRKELAGVLAAADRRAEAIDMLTTEHVLRTLDIRELLNLADLLTAENQLDRAEKELAKVVTDRSEKKYRVRYASILLWNAKHKQAQAVLTRLLRDFPDDREVRLRLAQSYLWASDYANALTRYSDLVSAKSASKQDEPLADPEIWRGFVDAAAGAAGESLREYPRKNIGPLFTSGQRDAIFKAYEFLTTVQARTEAENKFEMDRLANQGTDTDPTFEKRRAALKSKHDERMKGLAGSIGRLGLLLGMVGDRERSSSAFGAALAIDRNSRDVWLQYAQTLTALGDDLKAKAVFDWLVTTTTPQKVPPPSDIGPK
ncbi:MAG TPA: glycosyltransferase [Gemmataceae bacterium]|nr:glycosyltransferase [Gemmataceae bacterium]